MCYEPLSVGYHVGVAFVAVGHLVGVVWAWVYILSDWLLSPPRTHVGEGLPN